ncbi:MAG: DNA-3-methyladenine glycosylase I [Nitrospinae bacterium]|nr:DNA-3-methyladenine glycosylase I [Nitrospinota bacterium]
MEKKRCPWPTGNDLMTAYHDAEWGVPTHDDRKHFEFLILEAAQAGLSWLTVLKKREGYRKAFAGFDPRKVAKFDAKKIAQLLKNPEIIRNRLKVEAAVNNAKRFLEVQKEFGGFSAYCWGFVGNKPIVNKWKDLSQLPATSPESDAWSKDLKKRGFKFVGSTVIYAHMQATGMVNDHLTTCFRYRQVPRNP